MINVRICVHHIFYMPFREWTKHEIWERADSTSNIALLHFSVHFLRIIGNLSRKCICKKRENLQNWYWLRFKIGAHDRIERFAVTAVLLSFYASVHHHTKELQRWEVQPNKNGSETTMARAGTSSSSWRLLNYRSGHRHPVLVFYLDFYERWIFEEFLLEDIKL